MAAPVLPALTIADARPSRTASAARTMEASFFRRTPCMASSAMSMTSVAAHTSRSPGSSMASGCPTSTTGTPNRSAASRAPATISAGPLSPPITSTAMGSLTSSTRSPQGGCGLLVNLDGLAAAVPAAVGADHVGQLGLPALGAHAAGRAAQAPRRRAPAAALGLGRLLLRDSHKPTILLVSGETEHIEGRPPGIGRPPAGSRSRPGSGRRRRSGTVPGSPPGTAGPAGGRGPAPPGPAAPGR